MQFKRLRLVGFKSFVEPAELRIETGLTGVVGPNGCGKSNLLEAIRWVMGEGSAKSLRGGGMDDVIFAGTASRPSRDLADVTLTLDNSDRTAPPGMNDGDTIEVVRRIQRGLGSTYRVNGGEVRARDVQLLFADAATGAHSPALVSQNRIGAIISAKPAERRQLLEEAAGISGLHVRRKEAEIRLRATEANLLRLDDVLKGLETQAATLRRQAKSAEKYRALSERIRAAEAALLFARWTAASQAARAAKDAAAAAETQVGDAARLSARLGIAQAETAATIPALRDAEAAAAAGLQSLIQAQRALVQEAEAVGRRQRELAGIVANLARDREREATLTEDAATALDRLATEAAALEARAATARSGMPASLAAVAAAEVAAAVGEAALSQTIEAHARAAAQTRAAAAALETAEARWRRADAEARRLIDERTRDPGTAPLVARAAAATLAVETAAATVATATAAIIAAEGERRSAEAGREAASVAMLAARGTAAALTSERDALARLLAADKGQGSGLLDRITVAAGDELALAAALGDDLSASLGPRDSGRFWTASVGDDPALPQGAVPLSTRCEAPTELHRRLRQIGIVGIEDAPALAAHLVAGQRLVTRDGKLWRWDGFRAFGGQGVATAERLTRRNRMGTLAAELPLADAQLAQARAELSAVEDRMRRAGDAERSARAARATAERSHDTARSALVAATAELARAATKREAVDAAITRLSDDAAGFLREVEAARAAVDEITGLADLAAAVTATRATVEASRIELARVRASQAGLAREIDAGAARIAAITVERAGWIKRSAANAAQIAELARRADAAATEAKTLATRPEAITAEQAALAGQLHAGEAARRAAADVLATAETHLRALDAEARTIGETIAQAREGRARATANFEHEDARRLEVEALSGERFGCPPPLLPKSGDADRSPSDIAAEFDALTAERDRVGPVNLRADIELAELDATTSGSTAERIELETAIARLRGSIGSLNREGRVRLLAAFTAVDAHFRDLFGTLFAGGAAHLELIESDDPLEAGLEIMAQPPGKNLQSLTLLSGGEQALTAVALIFALFLTKPAPICVLDEVDAPLDDANVERFCDLLDRMASTTTTRFLIVTHNAVTMSRMHRLYGVTMSEKGVSQLVSVDLRSAGHLLAAE